MEVSRQRWLARLLLGFGVACGLLWLARLDYTRKISTDLLDLIPRDERNPEMMLARSLATAEHARVVLFVLDGPGGARLEPAAAAFIAALADSPAFADVVAMDDTTSRDALGRHVFENRLDLLAPGWLAHMQAAWTEAGRPGPWADWLAERTAADLEAFLSLPEAVAFQELLPGDPLLLVPELATQLQGLAQPSAGADGQALVWARTRADPLHEDGQEPVFAAVRFALDAARAVESSTTLRWAAISRFASENRHRIKSELEGLNLISFAAVLAVAAIGLRRLYSVLHLAPVLLCAVLAGWVGVTLAFERVHILVFVVGSLLGGVAIDYGFYLQLQPPLYPGEPYHAKVRRLLHPLLSSALTTVLGFLLLVVSDLPLIRQLGVFISAGLLGAMAAALLWFAQLRTSVTEARDFVHGRVPGRPAARAWLRRLVLAAAAGVALVGPWQLQWRDDIRELESLPEEMRLEAAEVRTLFGNTPDRTAFITRGDSPAAARAAIGRFLEAHGREHPGVAMASLGMVLPEPADWEGLGARRSELAGFAPTLRAALGRHGFEADEFAPFFAAWESWLATPSPEYAVLVDRLQGALRGPLALTLATTPGASWFMTIADHPPAVGGSGEPATIALDRLQSLNDLFLRYRISALRLSCVGLALVGASVLWIYGPRAGWRIFLLPLGSSLFTFGLFGLLGHPLNLFHLLGAFLGVCLSHNYAIFTAENARWSDRPAPSVRLSAVTTATSFGVLALSGIPVVAALGTTVATVVATALVLVELAPPVARAPGAENSGLSRPREAD